MSLCNYNTARTIATADVFHFPNRPGSFPSYPWLPNPLKSPLSSPSRSRVSLCSRHQIPNSPLENEENTNQPGEMEEKKKRISEQSSWEAKDSDGQDYLYRLGKEAENMNIAVGARKGMIDDLFVGNFLGKDSDIVFDYRQKVTRSFEYLQGDYYIAPLFMVMGIEPVIMSAGELESERAGEPGRLIRDRYRTASQVVENKGKMSCLMINDLDAGLGRFDNPTRVSIGQDWRESDVTQRVPVIVTGNDFSTLYAPLIRDGRMDKFYWQPNREDIINIVHRMYEKDGITWDEVVSIVDTFPNQALDFYGALRSRTYDRSISKWVSDIGGYENLGEKLLKRRKDDKLPTFIPPKQTLEALLQSGHSLIKEQELITNTRLSKEYMKNLND
ncbi:ribulose bisphosphate carboxylase/oxygenase activase, chloroplastic isoform X2 [Magnolia sinica]|uniref:ribulose bisphosphate carboxylase/oxygenase activase, chloroplastic isoform X2 n=1 Tax=Magnolia sinica TaxID=86752 RepID=UPI00265882A5|nr:ribulose bisphosphate carboxylase/oxygenase activase, chloroplastic isoform X2 [Magnolia sinica]